LQDGLTSGVFQKDWEETMCWRTFSVFFLTWLLGQAALLAQAYKDDIGLTALQMELGPQMLTGAGVTLSQVEALSDGYYAANPASFSGKTFVYASGTPSGYSSHATTVGSYIYGASGVASGMTQITAFEANRWIQHEFLRLGFSSTPVVETRDIANY